MAMSTAVAGPGRRGIHWLARTAAESVYRGSTVMIFVPASLAWSRYQLVLVSCMVVTGFHPHIIMRREFRRSSNALCEERVPYVASEAKRPPSKDWIPH